jgi:hypothetical protein
MVFHGVERHGEVRDASNVLGAVGEVRAVLHDGTKVWTCAFPKLPRELESVASNLEIAVVVDRKNVNLAVRPCLTTSQAGGIGPSRQNPTLALQTVQWFRFVTLHMLRLSFSNGLLRPDSENHHQCNTRCQLQHSGSAEW